MSYLSACITRILSLSAFDAALKTKDIQQAFSEWENDRGGFKIKWINDTSLLIVFADPNVAKRAYLQTLNNPPAQFISASGETAIIKPYDGPDAQAVIAAVNQRAQGGHRARASLSTVGLGHTPNGHHARGDSLAAKAFNNNALNGLVKGPVPVPIMPGTNGIALQGSILNNAPTAPGNGAIATGNRSREPSPTLPSLPTHPTLNALINSTLADMAAPSFPAPAPGFPVAAAAPAGAVMGTAPSFPLPVPGDRNGGSPPRTPPEGGAPTPPRLGNPAKRMLGSALGIRHPALGPRILGGGMSSDLQTIGEVHRALDGLAIAE